MLNRSVEPTRWYVYENTCSGDGITAALAAALPLLEANTDCGLGRCCCMLHSGSSCADKVVRLLVARKSGFRSLKFVAQQSLFQRGAPPRNTAEIRTPNEANYMRFTFQDILSVTRGPNYREV